MSDLTRSADKRAVLVVDLVESVLRMQSSELPFVRAWTFFVEERVKALIERLQGRLVKSLGDGVMIEFVSAAVAVQAALALQEQSSVVSQRFDLADDFEIRAGVHYCYIFIDKNDIYGAGVNLAARLASLAQPGETVVSEEVNELLLDDGQYFRRDLGECYLKHIEKPVRAWAIQSKRGHVQMRGAVSSEIERPTIGVFPFQCHSSDPKYAVLGEVIADGVIVILSKNSRLRVISRLSTGFAMTRDSQTLSAGKTLGASHVLSGNITVIAERVLLTYELSRLSDGTVLQADRLVAPLGDLFEAESELMFSVANAAHKAILDEASEKARLQTMPTLDAVTALCAGVSLMHRTQRDDFFLERHQRASELMAWRVKWLVFESVNGWSADSEKSKSVALRLANEAVEHNAGNAFANSMLALALGYLQRDQDLALTVVDRALSLNQSDSYAWLIKGMLFAFSEESPRGYEYTLKALQLSPEDPHKFYFHALAASAAISAGKYKEAEEFAQSSLRLNVSHLSTHRALVLAQSLQGKLEEATFNAQRMLKMNPHYSLREWRLRSPGAARSIGKKLENALRIAGVPE
jgi:adenylate cyclase